MSTTAGKTSVNDLLAEIHEKLDVVESHMAWLIKAEQRFRVGQRVRFSRRAIRHNLVAKTRTQVGGTVRAIVDSFSIRVEMDDRKHPKTYHHAAFNPVSGPKLF